VWPYPAVGPSNHCGRVSEHWSAVGSSSTRLVTLIVYWAPHPSSKLPLLLIMSTTALTTTDLLPSSVPKLMPNGLNWTAFSMRFQDAVEAKGLWGHFDGSITQPAISTPPAACEEEALAQWVKEDRTAKALLTHRIPDSTLIRVHSKPSLKDRWDLIIKEYSSKGAFAQAYLRTQFM
jgi:hypothetical protein